MFYILYSKHASPTQRLHTICTLSASLTLFSFYIRRKGKVPKQNM